MEMYNGEIKVGILAMIIGTRQVKNSHLIGKIVTVEALTSPGDKLQFAQEEFNGVCSKIEGAIVYALGIEVDGMLPGYSHINRKNLMPLPPLKEETKANQKEAVLS